ncbi:MAG: heavy-metal-associated domain-containing protein [Fidelibacterota bacterium]
MTEQITIRVTDMTCEGCASKIRTALESSEKIKEVDINIADKEVRVTGTLGVEEIFHLVKQAGYTPRQKKKGWVDRILN